MHNLLHYPVHSSLKTGIMTEKLVLHSRAVVPAKLTSTVFL